MLTHFDRPGASNEPTEVPNGRLEHRRGSAIGVCGGGGGGGGGAKIADSVDANGDGWYSMDTNQLADWIAGRGYSV